MGDFLTTVPSGPAPADLMARTARLPGMTDDDPSSTIGVIGGKTAPLRLQRGFLPSAYDDVCWADIADVFGDLGFRLHPDAHPDDPAIRSFCAPVTDGGYAVATWVEGDLAISQHDSYEHACAWIDVDPADDGSRFAFQIA